MRFLPLFLDLSTATVALVGNSAAATAKLRLLRSAGATVRWYSADVDVSVELLAACLPPGRVEIDLSDPLAADVSRFAAVVSAYGDARDEAIAQHARAGNTLINVVDRPDLSNFIVPASVDRGDVVVAIGTGGASPVLARRLRERIEALLPARIGDLSALMGRYRCAFARARHPLAFAAAFLGAGDRRADRRGRARRPLARGGSRTCARDRERAAAGGTRPASSISSAPAPAIPTC